jgi:uncharacterized FAD-dependent dehydrogenase
MLRLTEIKLPLTQYSDDDLRSAIVHRLAIAPADLLGFSVFRRGYDARKRSNILFIFTLDVELKDEAAVIKRLKAANNDSHISQTPDTTYKFVTQAPANLQCRPVVIGTGPLRPACRFDPRPDGLSSQSFLNAARPCASGPRTPGACGATTS